MKAKPRDADENERESNSSEQAFRKPDLGTYELHLWGELWSPHYSNRVNYIHDLFSRGGEMSVYRMKGGSCHFCFLQKQTKF